MARATELTPLTLAAYEVGESHLNGFSTEFPGTQIVVQQLDLCLRECRVHSTPTLLASVRLFLKDPNLPAPYIRLFLTYRLRELRCVILKERVSNARRKQLARFLLALQEGLPEKAELVPKVFLPA